jgi:hypothetical protein
MMLGGHRICAEGGVIMLVDGINSWFDILIPVNHLSSHGNF